MDKLTIKRIETLHPDIRAEVYSLYLIANNKMLGHGVRLRFSWTYRTPGEQNKLFAKRPKVTNARGWQSIHNYGLAFDIVLLYDNNRDGNFEQASWDIRRDGDGDKIADWMEVTRVFEDAGYQNGFIRNGKKWDRPHFQKTFGHKWRSLKKLVDSRQHTVEIINGKKYIYPIIKK